MEWFELYNLLLETTDKAIGGITEEGKEDFKKRFYYSLHDWYVIEQDNYNVKCHNEFIKELI